MSTTISPSRQYTPDDLLKMSEGKRFELVDGRLEQKPVGNRSSFVGLELGFHLKAHCKEYPTLGWVFGADAAYRCFPADANRIRRPDVSFVSRDRFSPDRLDEGFITVAPDLAVEVISPNDLAVRVNRKILEYLAVGVRLVWIAEPISRIITIYRSGGDGSLLRDTDELTGDDVLPGFRCRVADVFGGEPTAPA